MASTLNIVSGTGTIKRWNETTQSGTPATIASGVGMNLQNPSGDDLVPFMATGGLDSLQDSPGGRTIKKLYIGAGNTWKLLKNDIISYVSIDTPEDTGDYLVVSKPATNGALGQQYIKCMVAGVE